MISFYKNIPVLSYHKISDRKEIGLTSVSLAAFEKQLSYLQSEGFRSITSNDYKNAPNKAIIISFDDAYENIVSHAFPMMEHYGFKGLIFPILDYIGEENTWDANLGGIHFKHASLADLKQLLAAGWEIGAHSKSHSVYEFKKNSYKEIVDAKCSLEQKLETTIKSFSYPFGYITKEIEELVKKHYDYAFSATVNGKNDPHFISRQAVYHFDTIRHLENKIRLKSLESLKLKLIHSGAKATILYQNIKK